MNLQEELRELEGHFQSKHPLLWKCLNPGLSLEEINSIQIEKEINLTQEIIDLYLWHNGTSIVLPPKDNIDGIGYLKYAVCFYVVDVFLPLRDALEFRIHMSPEEIYFKTGILNPEDWNGFVSPFVAADFVERWGAGSVFCPCVSSPCLSLPLADSEFGEFPRFTSDSLTSLIYEINCMFEQDLIYVDHDLPSQLTFAKSTDILPFRELLNPRSAQLNALLYPPEI